MYRSLPASDSYLVRFMFDCRYQLDFGDFQSRLLVQRMTPKRLDSQIEGSTRQLVLYFGKRRVELKVPKLENNLKVFSSWKLSGGSDGLKAACEFSACVPDRDAKVHLVGRCDVPSHSQMGVGHKYDGRLVTKGDPKSRRVDCVPLR